MSDEFTPPTQPIILTKAEVEHLLPKLDIAALMKQLFLSLANGSAVQPAQTLTPFPQDKGDYITYLGVLAEQGVFGAKLSPYIVTEGAPIITAWTQLMSTQTGEPLLWCDSAQLTVERTAGTTALAIDELAPAQSQQLALVGAGGLAIAHLKHALPLREWQKITIFAPELVQDEPRCAAIKGIDKRIDIATSVDQAVNDADVIMLCTSSATPVITEQQIKSSAVVTSISTNAVNAHEVPPAWLNQAAVYCDYKQTTPESAGEMKLAAQLHDWDKAQICGDLADLVAKRCPRPDYSKPTFFRSIGLGLEDIAIAYGIWQQVRQNR